MQPGYSRTGEKVRSTTNRPRRKLRAQFRARRDTLGLTNEQLATMTGLPKQTVAQALSRSGERPVGDLVACVLARAMRMDVSHCLLVAARERLDNRLAQLKPAKSSNHRTQSRQVRQAMEELDWHIRGSGSFSPREDLQHLAMRQLRLQSDADLWERKLGRQLKNALCQWESGLFIESDEERANWLSRLTGELADLDDTESRLRFVHDLRNTLKLTERDRVDKPAVLHKPPGCSFMLGRSPTIYDSATVDLLEAKMPSELIKGGEGEPRRSTFRLVGGRDVGWEVAIVLEGSVRLTLKRKRFESEMLQEFALFDDDDAVVMNQECGPGKILLFRPSLLHHRLEFVHTKTSIFVLNIRQNLILGKRGLGPPEGPI